MDDFTFFVHPSFCIRECKISSQNHYGSLRWKQWQWPSIADLAVNVRCYIDELCKPATKNSSTGQKLVGIAIERSAKYIAAVAGVLYSGNAFVTLDPPKISKDTGYFALSHYTLRKCRDFGVDCIITKDFLDDFDANFLEKNGFYFYGFSIESDQESKNSKRIPYFAKNEDRIAYVIQTSGSIGQPKVVHVPFRAIMANVLDFKKRFQIDHLSRILFSTSLFFDPSMVELFLAMRFGTELAVLPPDWHSQNFYFQRFIIAFYRKFGVLEFAHFTPSVLQRFSGQFLREIFGSNAPIRNILIGGEPFPLNLVRQYYHYKCTANVFNIYGVTEVSAWATCFQVIDRERRIHDINWPASPDQVPIGDPLLYTRLSLNDDGTLLIGGLRKCFVDFQFDCNNQFFKTMDVVSGLGDEFVPRPPYCLRGRRDKPNGILPFTDEIEGMFLSQIAEIKFVKLISLGNCSYLFVNFGLDDFDSSYAKAQRIKLREAVETFNRNLPDRRKATRIFFDVAMDEFVTENGKIDERRMRDFCRTQLRKSVSKPKSLTTSSISTSWNLLRGLYRDLDAFCPSKDKTLLDQPLRTLGLGSLELTELAFLLEDSIEPNSKFSFLGKDEAISTAYFLQLLLDEKRMTLKTLLAIIDEVFLGIKPIKVDEKSKKLSELSNVQTVWARERSDVEVVAYEGWSSNLGKCVDATPVSIDGDVAYVGSHAGIFRGFNLTDGREIFAFNESFGSAIEAKCAVGKRFIAFGTLSGKCYIFGRESHQLFHVIQTMGEIRAPPIIFSCESFENANSDEKRKANLEKSASCSDCLQKVVRISEKDDKNVPNGNQREYTDYENHQTKTLQEQRDTNQDDYGSWTLLYTEDAEDSGEMTEKPKNNDEKKAENHNDEKQKDEIPKSGNGEKDDLEDCAGEEDNDQHSETAETICFASYDGSIYLVHIPDPGGNQALDDLFCSSTNEVLNLSGICSDVGLIRAAPYIALVNGRRRIFAATLMGLVLALDLKTQQEVWHVGLDSPVFADLSTIKPTKLAQNENLLIVVTVVGMISLLSLRNGCIKSQLKLPNAKTFDAPTIIRDENGSYFLLSCANYIFVLELVERSNSIEITLQKIVQIDYSGFSTVRSPVLVENFHLFVLSTNGVLLRFRASELFSNSSLVFYERILRLDEPTFGAPVIFMKSKMQQHNLKAFSTFDNDDNVEFFRVLLGTRADHFKCYNVEIRSVHNNYPPSIFGNCDFFDQVLRKWDSVIE